jgi:hypothetical protein
MDDAAWGALALALTVLGGVWTWVTYQRRGLAPALRAGALTLLPVAAWLTGVLGLVATIGGSIGDWALDLAFDPTMWVGAGLAGLAAVLYVVAGHLGAKRVGQEPREAKRAQAQPQTLPEAGPPDAAPAVDAEMAEIEAILRRRGIT